MVERLVKHARVLWRAESILTEIRLKRMMTRSGLVAAAALIASFGLAMLNVAGFFWLEPAWGPAGAALWIGGADFVIALLLLLVALRAPAGREMELAMEVRQAALDGLEDDARLLQAELVALRDETFRLRDSLLGLVKHPLEAALTGLVVPLAGALLKGDRKKGKAGD
jgi:hypothetical protein